METSIWAPPHHLYERSWRLPRALFRFVLSVGVALLMAAGSVLALAIPANAAVSGPIVGVASGRCLDVTGNSTALRTRIIIWDCHGQANQIWTLTAAGELRVFNGSRCLDVDGGRLTAGAVVQIYTCWGGPNQKWTVNANGAIVGVQSGLCLDVSGASTAGGSYVQMWTCHGGGNQQWRTDTSLVIAPTPTVLVTPSPSPSPSPTSAPVGQPVITRSGTQLQRAGVEWRAVGFNLPNILGCNTADTNAATDSNLDRYFAGLPAHSLTRIWPYGNSQWRTVMPRVVKAAEAHGQYLLAVLADANASGTQCGSNLGATYPADGGAVKTHATNVVTAFKDSPAIAIWEVLNEGTMAASAKPFYAAVVAEVRRIDPYAVVGYGAGTCYQSVGTAAWNECKDTIGQPGNDFVDFHEYDAGTGVSPWTDENQKIAIDTGKPWLTGEFGFCCNGAPSGFTSLDAANGSDYVKAEWSSYLNAGASAVLYWSAVLAPTTAADQLSPSKAAWPGIGTYTHQWQGN